MLTSTTIVRALLAMAITGIAAIAASAAGGISLRASQAEGDRAFGLGEPATGAGEAPGAVAISTPGMAGAESQPLGVTAPPRGHWCLTHERYLESLRREGGEAEPRGACAPLGVCDNPADRNASIPDANTPIKTYRLSIHVFCDNSGSNCAATANDVEVAVQRLNTNFEPWRIQFVHEMRFINSTKYRTLDPSEESGMKRSYAISPATRLNIYVVDTGGVAWGHFPWMSTALTNQGGIVMDDTWFGASSGIPSVLTHEVGHCLGLWHVFHGVDEVAACTACYEAAGRTPEEGDITGDLCSDTNPTPRNTNICSDPPSTDPCSGNPWVDTPYANYMSYGHNCSILFTPQQAGRMHCWTDDRLSGWLQLPMPPAAPGTPTLTKLAGGVVRVAWADNSNNEDGFQVQRERKQGRNWVEATIVADVGANTTTVDDAPGSGTFRYRVLAYNAIGPSAWSGWRQVNN